MATRAVTVGTTVGQMVADNPKRTAVSIMNFGSDTIFWSNDRGNVTSQGFPLLAGLSVDFSAELGDDPTLEVNGQSLVGNTDIRVYEAFGEGGR